MSMQIIILLRMTAELDRSRPVKNGGDKKTTRSTGSSQHAHDRRKLRQKGMRRVADSRDADSTVCGQNGGV